MSWCALIWPSKRSFVGYALGEKPGYPRFRGQGRYASITYPQVPVGCKLDADARRLRLHGVGPIKIILHRQLEGTPKTATISRSGTGKWYVCFSCECAESSPLPVTGQQVGIDVGLKTFATFSRGQEIASAFAHGHEQRHGSVLHALATRRFHPPAQPSHRQPI